MEVRLKGEDRWREGDAGWTAEQEPAGAWTFGNTSTRVTSLHSTLPLVTVSYLSPCFEDVV
jgi:hypothetical protein